MECYLPFQTAFCDVLCGGLSYLETSLNLESLVRKGHPGFHGPVLWLVPPWITLGISCGLMGGRISQRCLKRCDVFARSLCSQVSGLRSVGSRVSYGVSLCWLQDLDKSKGFNASTCQAHPSLRKPWSGLLVRIWSTPPSSTSCAMS